MDKLKWLEKHPELDDAGAFPPDEADIAEYLEKNKDHKPINNSDVVEAIIALRPNYSEELAESIFKENFPNFVEDWNNGRFR